MKSIARLTLVVLLVLAGTVEAQWTHRYPKIKGMSHHVYLEGYELPTLTIGPMDPAPAPDGQRIAFASRGWLWVMDLNTGIAKRLTTGGSLDSRPAWSPDGKRLAFVRDDSRETSIMEIELASGREKVLVDEPAIDLDPSYSPDGASLYYSSAAAGDLDVWRLDLTSGAKTRITAAGGQELQPLVTPDGLSLVYIAKTDFSTNEIRVKTLATGEEKTLVTGPILSMLRIAMRNDGRTLAITWPASDADGWELKLLSLVGAPYSVLLTSADRLPLAPAFSPDGKSVYYAEADGEQRMRLHRIAVGGGRTSEVPVSAWDWGTATGRIRIDTHLAGGSGTTPARLSVIASNGHPLLPDRGQPRFDGQNGIVFFYSEGSIELTGPLGDIQVQAVQGITTPVVRARGTVAAGGASAVDVTLTPIWDAHAAGWYAGEHHFHLNYGGPYHLPPEALITMGRAEAMDVLTPLLANLHTRYEDQPLFQWRSLNGTPLIAWGQEVRSHFLGHLGLVGAAELYWPWTWGPGYEVNGADDRTNGEVLAFARSQGAMSTYVHPISVREPFTEAGMKAIPVEMVADGVLGAFDTIELVCLWSDELGSADMWYRLLNFGIPVAISAGTDVMNNLYRTMAIGTTRVYVKTDPALGYRGYLEALKAGRSFATNGPMLQFKVDGVEPGGVAPKGGKSIPWTLELQSAVAVDSVEIMVNGARVTRLEGVAAGGSRHYQGVVALPAGGWVAVRALGGPTDSWPAMDSYAFGHTAPIWIGAKGSTTPATRQAAAVDLSKALEVALGRLRQSYQGTGIPRLEAQFAKARSRLDSVLAK